MVLPIKVNIVETLVFINDSAVCLHAQNYQNQLEIYIQIAPDLQNSKNKPSKTIDGKLLNVNHVQKRLGLWILQ